MIDDNGWIDNCVEYVSANRFDLDIQPLKLAWLVDFDMVEKLNKACFSISGIGTDTIVCKFYDHPDINMYEILKQFSFGSLTVCQYRPDHTMARKIEILVKEHAVIGIGELNWTSNSLSYITAIFEVDK